MNIGIVGGGSIGLLVSSYLAEKHVITIYVRRNAQKEAINKCGIQRNGVQCKGQIRALLIDELKQEKTYIICVKQTHMEQVIPYMNAAVKKQPVLFLQNGMGHLEQVNGARYPIYVGVVEHGAIKMDDYSVQHTGKGLIKVASYSGDVTMLSNIVNTLEGEGFPIRVAADWEMLLKNKLIINAVINPLTALFNVRNGAVISIPYIETLAYVLCKETASVLELDNEDMWQKVRTVATNTSENISSMLHDMKQQQQTEIEAITGYILRKSNVEVPNTAFIYHSIKALEEILSKPL